MESDIGKLKKRVPLYLKTSIRSPLVIVLEILELLISENSLVGIILAFSIFSFSSLLVDSQGVRVSV